MQGQVQTNRKEVMHNEEKDWPLVPPRRTSTLTETRFEQFRENAKTASERICTCELEFQDGKMKLAAGHDTS